jgi:predicted ABC-type ATPase
VKDIVMIGGPNGAGKTTAAPAVVPRELGIHEFVNADEIARGLSPFNAERAALAAGRLMIERMRTLVRDGESFAFETTCAGRAHGGWLRACKLLGCPLCRQHLIESRGACDKVGMVFPTMW